MLHEVQIPHLLPREIRPDQNPRVLPICAIRVEDSMSQQFDCGLSAQLSHVKIAELRGQNTLHILRFVSNDQCLTQNIRRECWSDSSKSGSEVLELILFPLDARMVVMTKSSPRNGSQWRCALMDLQA